MGRILDAETGREIPATVTFQSNAPPEVNAAARDSGIQENQGLTQRVISAGQFENALPLGETTITVSRGFEYLAERRQIDLHAGERLQLIFRLRRQVNLRLQGWYCGDNHVHMIHGSVKATPHVDFPYIALAARAVGLDYLSVAQDWNLPASDINPEHLSELCERASTPDFILNWNMEEPKNYWRGDVSHCLGHCWFLGMRGYTPQGQDAIQELYQMSAHDYESEKTPTPNFDSHALIHELGGMVAYTHPCRWSWGTWGGEGIYPVEKGKFISNLAQELPFDTLAGPTYDAIDILMSADDRNNYLDAQRLWFMLLNKGYRIAGTASTDTAFNRPERARPGIVRVYTRIEGPPNIPSLARAMKAGKNFVTSGPLLLLHIAGHSVGDVIHIGAPAEFRVSLQAWPSGMVGEHLTRVEMIRNGEVVKNFSVESDQKEFSAHFDVRESGTAWYIARCFGSTELQVAITNPIYFEGDDYHPPQPVLAHVTGMVFDKATSKPLNGQCEIIRMVGMTPVVEAQHPFSGGRFKFDVPGTARLRVDVLGYKPEMKSVFLDYEPLLGMTLNLREAELTDWRTFSEIRDELGHVNLEFPLVPAK